jgi:hypothetical protein
VDEAEHSELKHFEQLVADALTSLDSAGKLERAARDASLPQWMRDAFRSARPDGVRISALLVAKLRFERVIQSSRHAAQWFERDARSFTAAFKRYLSSVSPSATLATDEGREFDAWCAANELQNPSVSR